jgi:hypothetical protein
MEPSSNKGVTADSIAPTTAMPPERV